MIQLSLDAESGVPLADQIVGGIRALIDDRVLRAPMRVPPIRVFAQKHQLGRFTVAEAYDRLVALGYLQAKRGSGFYVAARNDGAAAARRNADEPPFDRAAAYFQTNDDDDDARLGVGNATLPADWFDQDGLRRRLRALAARADQRLVTYGTPRGYLPLRQQLQSALGELGIAADPAQIVLTQGAAQALDLAARYLLEPGDCAFVDDPGYHGLFASLRLHGIKLVGVARTPAGPDVDALAALLAEHRPKVFFTQSVLHNPTGGSLSPATAFRVLQLAEQHDFLIVEDDVYADLHPGAASRLAQFDQLRRVLYVGSYSKTLSADLRVGFIACNGAIASALTDIKAICGASTSEFSESLIHQMLSEGSYRKHLERTRTRLAAAIDACLRLLERVGMPVYAEPRGGMFVWAAVPGATDAVPLVNLAARAGIALLAGNVLRPHPQASPWLRINVAYALDARFERFLGETLGKLTA